MQEADMLERFRRLVAAVQDLIRRRRQQAQGQQAEGLGAPSPEAQQRLQMRTDAVSKQFETISNVAKVGGATQDAITRNMRPGDVPASSGGAGGSASGVSWQAKVGVAAVVLAGGMLLSAALFVSARHFIFARPFVVTPMHVLAAPPPAVIIPLPGGATMPPDSCEVELIYPVSDEPIPPGPLHVEWTPVQDVSSYALAIRHAADTSRRTLYVGGSESSTDVTLDYFSEVADFEMTLSVLNADGYERCSTSFTLHSDGYALRWPPAGSGSSGKSVDQGGPTWDPADDTVDYGACAGCDGNGGDAVDDNQQPADDAPEVIVQPTPTWDPADETVDYGSCAGCDGSGGDVIVK